MDSPEVRRDKLANALKWTAGLVGAVVISPFVFLAVKGLVGLALAAAVGLAVTQFAPVYTTLIANWRMKALIAVVQQNPIETMLNLYVAKKQELADTNERIIDFDTEVRNYDGQVKTFSRQYPEEAGEFQEISRAMHTGLDDMRDKYKQATDDLADFEQQVNKAKAIYAMALAAEKVTKLSHSTEQQVFNEIKQKVAFDTVQSRLNRSFAVLNSSVSQQHELRAKPAALLTGGSPVQTIPSAPVLEAVPVRRKG